MPDSCSLCCRARWRNSCKSCNRFPQFRAPFRTLSTLTQNHLVYSRWCQGTCSCLRNQLSSWWRRWNNERHWHIVFNLSSRGRGWKQLSIRRGQDKALVSSRRCWPRTFACRRSTCQCCSTFRKSQDCEQPQFCTLGAQRRDQVCLGWWNPELKWFCCSFGRTKANFPRIKMLNCFAQVEYRANLLLSTTQDSQDMYSALQRKSRVLLNSFAPVDKPYPTPRKCFHSDGAHWRLKSF